MFSSSSRSDVKLYKALHFPIETNSPPDSDKNYLITFNYMTQLFVFAYNYLCINVKHCREAQNNKTS